MEYDPATKQLAVLEDLTSNNGYSWRGTPMFMENVPFSWPKFVPVITGAGIR